VTDCITVEYEYEDAIAIAIAIHPMWRAVKVNLAEICRKIMKCIFLSVTTGIGGIVLWHQPPTIDRQVASIKRKRQTLPHAATCAAQ